MAHDTPSFTVSLARQESSGTATKAPCTSEDSKGVGNVERGGSSRHLGNDDHLLPSKTASVQQRKRPSEEIKELHAQVAGLQETFTSLIHTLKVDDEAKYDDDEIPWKYRADRKLNAVLLENQKLKMMLAGRLRVARAFQQAIDHHVRLLARKLPWPSGSDRQSLPDELIFALLDEEKEYQLSLTDEVMEVSGIARTKYRVQSRIQLHQNGIFLHGEVRELPFPVLDVAAALCNCFAHGVKADTAESKRCRKLCMKENSFYAVTVEALVLVSHK
ncbi:hypothetical protein ON010_g13942 [Phytophthora cinnamomi]|nr:hypothetical protein ON010_g13942 [Phytophthora cinnamomi]